MRVLKKSIWPFSIAIDTAPKSNLDHKITEWCQVHIGHRFNDWYSYSGRYSRIYAFKDQETLLYFKLRWENCHE